ncbi:MAG: hypothetical protein FGM14_08525 [Flavobacteriales bacterium]|nr:hypothetical protein [Flavobacteriales bacterium]
MFNFFGYQQRVNVFTQFISKLSLTTLFIFSFQIARSQDTLVTLKNEKEVVSVIKHTISRVVYSTYPISDIRKEMLSDEIEYIHFKNGKIFRYNPKPIVEQPITKTENKIITTIIQPATNQNNDSINPNSKFDIIVYKNGDEIASKIMMITDNEVVYKKYDFLDGPSYSVNKSTIFMIKYSNGQKDIFSKEINTQKSYLNSNFTESTIQGENDAIANYRTGGAFAAGFSSFILTPLIALIPTAIITSFEPNDSNLKYPNMELYNTDLYYKAAYKKQAIKMRNKAVWAGYGFGAFINIVVGAILLTQ